ncbi:MAG TPA: helix-hairpin-helix domain-containing protein [Paraburkholderia sp.]|nr:helix-hairpin-helix domain-containing protein [Paraburkholderia sp.]
MFRKILVAATMLAAFAQVFAAVDVNTANEDALRGIKGIGPARAKAILDERNANGPFKDAADLGKRVKGMGGHTVERLEGEGLAVGPAQATAQSASAAQGKSAPAATGAKPDSTTVVVKK